ERLIDRRHGEMTGASVEVGEIAWQEVLPTSITDAPGQHGVEDEAASRRKNEAPLHRREPAHVLAHTLQVGAAPAEALRPEVIGHAARLNCGEAARERGIVDRGAANPDGETVAGERPAGKLAGMVMCLEDLVFAAGDPQPVLRGEPRLRYSEPLRRHRPAILRARIAHIPRRAATGARQLAGDPMGIGVALANSEEHVLAGARR